MSVHEQFAEDLALHALGSLQGNELVALETHLQSCADCRRELELLRGDMALLAMSTTGSAPPRHARPRLLDAVAREPRQIAASVPSRRGRWGFAPWFATAAAAVIIVLLLRQNSELQGSIAALNTLFTDQKLQLQRAEDMVETLTAAESQQVTLVAAKNTPQPQGKTFYLRNKGSLIFLASNMPDLPLQKAYELWLIPTSGAPIPAGVFKPNARGSATVIDPPLPAGVEAKAFAITIEPEAGSTTPTMPIVMLGSGE